MLSIKENNSTIVIKNSKFITYTYQVHNMDDINNKLNIIRDKYKDATHICYAYIIDGNIKCNDDGEPNGTAGIPILDVLKKNNLNHVLCIVIRYFGKIKLGAGGLVRAYSNSASLCIKDNIIEIENANYVDIIFNYELSKTIDNLLNSAYIINKEYNDKVIYHTILKEETIKSLKNIKDIEIIIKDNTYI